MNRIIILSAMLAINSDIYEQFFLITKVIGKTCCLKI